MSLDQTHSIVIRRVLSLEWSLMSSRVNGWTFLSAGAANDLLVLVFLMTGLLADRSLWLIGVSLIPSVVFPILGVFSLRRARVIARNYENAKKVYEHTLGYPYQKI